MRLAGEALARHLYVIGGTGVGKSKAIQAWALELLRHGNGVGVFDVHGDLYDELLAYIAMMPKHIWDRLEFIDPTDPLCKVKFNPFEPLEGVPPSRQADIFTDTLLKVFRVDPEVTQRMQAIMRHTFWLLIESGLTLLAADRILYEKDFREEQLQQLPENHPLRRFWTYAFPREWNKANEWVQSTFNKINPFVTDPEVARLFDAPRSTINFRSIMDEGKILLVKLSKGIIGDNSSRILGAFLLTCLQQAALKRAEAKYAPRKRFVLFLDEFQNYASDEITTILSESRKYGLALVLAHQFYGQLREIPELQQAVVGTVGNLIVFQVGREDALKFSQDIFSPPLEQVKDVRERWRPTGFQWWPYQKYYEVVHRPLAEIWELAARQLSNLEPRLFFYKQRGSSPPVFLRTPDVPSIRPTPQLWQRIDELRTFSAVHHEIPESTSVSVHEVIQTDERPKKNELANRHPDKKREDNPFQADNAVPPYIVE